MGIISYSEDYSWFVDDKDWLSPTSDLSQAGDFSLVSWLVTCPLVTCPLFSSLVSSPRPFTDLFQAGDCSLVSLRVTCHLSYVTCYLLLVTCHMSLVHLSLDTCHSLTCLFTHIYWSLLLKLQNIGLRGGYHSLQFWITVGYMLVCRRRVTKKLVQLSLYGRDSRILVRWSSSIVYMKNFLSSYIVWIFQICRV